MNDVEASARRLDKRPDAVGMCLATDGSCIVVFTETEIICFRAAPISDISSSTCIFNVLQGTAASAIESEDKGLHAASSGGNGLDPFSLAWRVRGLQPLVGELTGDGQLLVVSLRRNDDATSMSFSGVLSSSMLRLCDLRTGTPLLDVPTSRTVLYLQFGCGGDLIGIGERHRIAVYKLTPPSSQQDASLVPPSGAVLVHERMAPAVDVGLTNFLMSPAVDAFVFSFGKSALRSSQIYGLAGPGKELTDAGGGAVYGRDGDTLFLAPTTGLLEGFDINAFRLPPIIDEFGIQSQLQLLPSASHEGGRGLSHDAGIRCVALSQPLTRHVVTVSPEETCIWDALTFRLVRHMHTTSAAATNAVDFAEDDAVGTNKERRLSTASPGSDSPCSSSLLLVRPTEVVAFHRLLDCDHLFNRPITLTMQSEAAQSSPVLAGANFCTTDGHHVIIWNASTVVLRKVPSEEHDTDRGGHDIDYPSTGEGGKGSVTAVAIGGRRPRTIAEISQSSPLVIVVCSGSTVRLVAWSGNGHSSAPGAASFHELRRLQFDVPACRDTDGTIRRVSLSSSGNFFLVGGFGRSMLFNYDLGRDVPGPCVRHLADDSLPGVWTFLADLGHESRAPAGFDLAHDPKSFSAMRLIFSPDSRWDVEPPRVYSTEKLAGDLSGPMIADSLVRPPRVLSGNVTAALLAGDSAFVATDVELFSALVTPPIPMVVRRFSLDLLGYMLREIDVVCMEEAAVADRQIGNGEVAPGVPQEQLPDVPQRPSAEAIDASGGLRLPHNLGEEDQPSPVPVVHSLVDGHSAPLRTDTAPVDHAARFSDSIAPIVTRLHHSLVVASASGLASVPLALATATQGPRRDRLARDGESLVMPFPCRDVRRLRVFGGLGDFTLIVLLCRHHLSTRTTVHVARVHDDSASFSKDHVVEMEGLVLQHADDGNTAVRAAAERMFLRSSVTCSLDGKRLLVITASYSTHRSACIRSFDVFSGAEEQHHLDDTSSSLTSAVPAKVSEESFPPVQDLPPGASDRVEGYPSGLEGNDDGSVVCRCYDKHGFAIFCATTRTAQLRRRSIIKQRTVGKAGETEWWLAVKCARFAPIPRSPVVCGIDGHLLGLYDAEAQHLLAAIDLPDPPSAQGGELDGADHQDIGSIAFLRPGDGRPEPTVPAVIAVAFRDSSVHVAYYSRRTLSWTLHVSPQTLRRGAGQAAGGNATIAFLLVAPSLRHFLRQLPASTLPQSEYDDGDQPAIVVVTSGRTVLVFPFCTPCEQREAADTAEPVLFHSCRPESFVQQVMYQRL